MQKENTLDPTQPSAFTEIKGAAPPETLVLGEDSRAKTTTASARAEIDTSSPFESVKEAVNLFGGSAVWNSQLRELFLPNKPHCVEEFEALNLEEQAAQLGKDLILKEWETLDVLKELERTKDITDDLKLRLQKEASEVNSISQAQSSSLKGHPFLETERENPRMDAINSGQSSGTIFDKFKQARMNLSRTTCDLSKIHAFTGSLHSQIDCEITLVEKTREKLTAGTSIVSFLEEDLNQAKLNLQLTKEANDKCKLDPADFSREVEQLRSKIEQFRQTAAAAKSEASKLSFEIERMQAGIKSAEIRMFAAKKMEEAARAAEAVALAKIEVVISSKSPNVVLPYEEHAMLTHKVHKADESSRDKIVCEVERANLSKLGLLADVDKAAAEVKVSRKVLENALSRLEAANSSKMAVEEALRRWTPKHGQKWLYNSTKFQDSYPAGTNHALSIGEILCKKLMGLEEHENDIATTCVTQNENADISLGQILNRRPAVLPPRGGLYCKQQAAKRKRMKLGFVGLSQLLKQEGKKGKNKKKRRVLIPVNDG